MAVWMMCTQKDWPEEEMPFTVQKGFPGGTSGKEPACQCRRHKRQGFNPWSGRSSEEGNGNPRQYSYLENPMDRSLVGYSPRGRKELDTTETT